MASPDFAEQYAQFAAEGGMEFAPGPIFDGQDPKLTTGVGGSLSFQHTRDVASVLRAAHGYEGRQLAQTAGQLPFHGSSDNFENHVAQETRLWQAESTRLGKEFGPVAVSAIRFNPQPNTEVTVNQRLKAIRHDFDDGAWMSTRNWVRQSMYDKEKDENIRKTAAAFGGKRPNFLAVGAEPGAML